MPHRISDWANWLIEDHHSVPKRRYAHSLLVENVDGRPAVMGGLSQYVNGAIEPALSRLRAPFVESLHPSGNQASADPARGYPHLLDHITLQGYFGEILAGAVADHCRLLGSDRWEVPAFLFHTHDLAFQELCRIQQGGSTRTLFGRTGNDCLAFQRDDSGTIVRIMCCEAKLTADHSAGLIAQNHESLSAGPYRPVNIAQVIEALKLIQQDDFTAGWIAALQEFYFSEPDPNERVDMCSYSCGRKPRRNPTWMSRDKPHSAYSAGRWLVAVEIHLKDVLELVETVFTRGPGP